MKKYRLKVWSESAVSGILFAPDRKKVQQELYDHMLDRYEALIEQGLNQEEAEKQAVAAMGDSWETARQLAAVHRPFWGYFLRATRVILILSLCVSLIPAAKYIWDIYSSPPSFYYDTRDPEKWIDKGHSLQSSWKQDASFKTGISTFRLTEATLWTQSVTDSYQTDDCLVLQVEETCFVPWGLDENYHWSVFTPGSWIWAEDSNGNYYYSFLERDPAAYSTEKVLQVQSGRTGLFTFTYMFWINRFDTENIQWLDLHYDRDGRDYTLRVNLKGGGEE